MAIKYSSSVHGTTAFFHTPHPETLDATGVLIRPSPTASSTTPSEDWAHFSIPTPIVIDQQPLHVVSVWLRYANSHGAKLMEVRLHDGEREIAAWNPHPFTQHVEIMTEVLRIERGVRVEHGLCLSVRVVFGEGIDVSESEWIKFVAAGVDFAAET
jgi:hypothetical protein